MRIAFYSPQAGHLEPDLAQGGDPIFLQNLFAELRRRGHKIEVISSLNVRHVWKGKVPARGLLAEALAVRRRVKEFRPEAWLVYNPSRTHPDLFGWWQPTKQYVVLAGQMHQSDRIPRRWRPLLAWAHRRSLLRADLVTAARPRSFERLLRHGVERERLRLIPVAVPIWGPVLSQEDARRRLGLPLESPIVLGVARFTPPYGGQGKTEMILNLLSVAPSLTPDVLIVVAGDGPGRSLIEAEVSRLQLGQRVRLVGAVENADLKWFYAACDLYAYPYPIDIPSVSVLEAQACGRPVVTMRNRSGELTVDAGTSGLLADALEEFRDHLVALTRDRARCAAMGSAARRYVAQFHSMDVRARQIEGVLQGRA